MRGINKAIIAGHLGQDPDVRYSSDGKAVCNISIATKDRFKDHTEWHRVVAFGKLAEIMGQYLKKGSAVHIIGRLQTRKWEKDGIDRYSTEIIAEEMEMLGGKRTQHDTQPPAASGAAGDGFDDIPFAPVDWRAS